MQSNARPSRLTLRHRLILAHAAVTVMAILIAEATALGALALLGRWPAPVERALGSPPAQGLHMALVTVGAALAGSLLGAWASRGITRRLRHTLEISRAWLRGNLSLRIADPTPDDLGLLAERLDLLAEHLEQDEQDLDEMRETNTRLTDQVRALAVVEERNRLARELHDGVKQHLFSLAMTASGIRTRVDALRAAPDGVGKDVTSGLAEMVREVETAAQTAQREMTRLIEDLRPGSLQEQGLAAALNDYTLLFGAREHILVYLDVQGNDALLPPSTAEALYRVAQEALHNVARHARATRVDVHLHCIPEQAALTLRDNGVGFDTGRARRGLGLANMQERMMTVGGRLAVESQIGAGTMVLAEVGLTHPLSARGGIVKPERDRPNPTIENWAWLGQRLVTPVGQTWPWHSADQAHLRRPLVEPAGEPLVVRRDTGFLGLRRDYLLQWSQQHKPLVRVRHSKSGYEWESEDASWALRRIRGLSGRMVLTRNGQPLAAMQHQGRLLNTWSEIIYDGRGYRLSHVKGQPCSCALADAVDDGLLFVEGGPDLQVELRRAVPLPLLVMAAARIVDEAASIAPTAEAVEASA
jgi:signal transduction histidine kinase